MRGFGYRLMAIVLGLAGCHTAGSRTDQCPADRKPCDRCNTPAPADVRLTPYPPAPASPGTIAPSGTYIPPEPTAVPPTPASAVPPPAPVPAGPVGRAPSGDPRFQPVIDAQVHLEAPQKYTPEPMFAQVRLDVPVPVRRGAKPIERVPQDPNERVEKPLPVDLPQFEIVRDRVATGQQPFPEGVRWLKTQGYRTVLQMRAPGEDAAACRRKFEEMEGLRYVSLEVPVGGPTRELLEEFNRIVGDKAKQPLFVFDNDGGSLTGSFWYAHFRLAGMSEDRALIESNRLGFRPIHDEKHKAMLKAVKTAIKFD